MIKKIVIRNGKKYIVNVPSWPEFGMDLGIGSAGSGSFEELSGSFRITETEDIRITEDGLYRIIE